MLKNEKNLLPRVLFFWDLIVFQQNSAIELSAK